eukprot:TRINITY_DN430_c0_g1_i1.p1 TRINITY_DN430_c0_g1~~TRINITY_DN430_c0_g1_i1.p1  ORF type:complete len:240 (+),score=73.79 TRINITY_DN430_c0_g1_i1:267-986(+)
MASLKGLFKPKVDPKEQVREWQRKLRAEMRNCEKSIRDIEREEAQVKKSIKEAAKRGDMASAKSLAAEIVRSRKAVNRLHQNKAQLNSVSMHLNENLAMVRAVGHLSKSTEVMKMMNTLIKAPEMAKTMMDMEKEMVKAGVMEEMLEDTIGNAMDSEEMEEETEEEVSKVLTELAVETAASLPAAAKEKAKMPAKQQPAAAQAAGPSRPVAVAEGDEREDTQEEVDAIHSRLEALRTSS